jgi:hypothetical protein
MPCIQSKVSHRYNVLILSFPCEAKPIPPRPDRHKRQLSNVEDGQAHALFANLRPAIEHITSSN